MNEQLTSLRNLTIFNLLTQNEKIIENNNLNNNILNFSTNEFYDDIMNIIGSDTYLGKGVLADVDDIDENYYWYIVSSIHIQIKLDDKITLWKYIEKENKWYEKIISARLLLQLNGT